MYSNQIFEIYCAGKFIPTSKILDIKNPYDNSKVAKTFLAGVPEFEVAIAAAQSVEEELVSMPSFKRFNILKQISVELLDLRQQFAELISFESGKPIRYALAEVDRSIQTFAVAAEESKRLPSEYLQVDWTPAGVGKEALLKYFPVGIVAGRSTQG